MSRTRHRGASQSPSFYYERGYGATSPRAKGEGARANPCMFCAMLVLACALSTLLFLVHSESGQATAHSWLSNAVSTAIVLARHAEGAAAQVAPEEAVASAMPASSTAQVGEILASGEPTLSAVQGSGPTPTVAQVGQTAVSTNPASFTAHGSGSTPKAAELGETEDDEEGGAWGERVPGEEEPPPKVPRDPQFDELLQDTLETRARMSVIRVEDVPECAVPRPRAPCRIPKGRRIDLVIVSAMWERESQTKDETELMLKSILYGTRCPMHLHFMVSGEPEISVLKSLMDSIHAVHMVPVPSPLVTGQDVAALSGIERRGYYNDTKDPKYASHLLYSFHFIPEDWVLEQARRLDLFPLDHHAGVPGFSKFFMPEILWQVRRALFLDVDIIFAGDIQDLYESFRFMEKHPELLFYLSNNNPDGNNVRSRYRWLRPYCSCEMVLHLERMRHANMSKLFQSTLGGVKPRDLVDYVADGDQFLFMRTCKVLRHVCRILPRMWNVSGCSKPARFLGLSARGREVNGSCWRVVHFNCMGHMDNGTGIYSIPEVWTEAYNWAASMSLPLAAQHHMQ